MEETEIKNPIQLKFFERLKLAVPQNISLASEMSEILEISADGAYRRMRGETVLSMDELVKLCRHYKIPPDILANPDDTAATFYFRKMIRDEEGFKDYLQNMLNDLQKINASNPKQIIFAAGDLPIFSQFQFPDYAAFKTFFWQRAILNLRSVEGKKFSIAEKKPEMAAACKKIFDTYIQIPSIEIWHDDTVSSNLKLIEFAWDSGLFSSKEDALHICSQVSALLSSVEKQAEKSSKFNTEEKWAENEGNFTLYQSELLLTNNHVFVTAGTTKMLYLTHNTFNTMATTNTVFCNETDEWLKNLIRKSARISGEGEKQRHKFFKKCQEKVSALSSSISNQ